MQIKQIVLFKIESYAEIVGPLQAEKRKTQKDCRELDNLVISPFHTSLPFYLCLDIYAQISSWTYKNLQKRILHKTQVI